MLSFLHFNFWYIDGGTVAQVILTLMQGLNLNMLSLLSYGSQFLVEVETELERRWRREMHILEQGTCYMEEQQHNQLVKQFNTQVMLAAQEIKHNCKSYQVGTLCIRRCS